uniref:Programmed cell death 5 n=1 Tax=Theropithecus gelada TaxID=9565 RepID=A0A8D2K2J3_THEGE
MADEELEALRRQRLAELQAKHGDPGDAAQQEAKHREAEMRNSILAQVLDQSARARLTCTRTRYERNCNWVSEVGVEGMWARDLPKVSLVVSSSARTLLFSCNHVGPLFTKLAGHW